MSAQHLPRQRFLQNLRGRVIGHDQATTLVIGQIGRWTSDGRTMPEVEDLTYVEFETFSVCVLEDKKPDVVLSPLVTDTFDAFEIAHVLHAFGFQGRYRAVAPYLPNLQMIRSEVAAAAPGLDFDIVEMPPTLVSVS